MFLFHIAFALGLIALALGVYFLVWACSEKDGAGVAKTFGYIIVILAIISLLCTFYYNMKLWKAGYYQVFPRVMTVGRTAATSSQPVMIQRLQAPQRQQQKSKSQSRLEQNITKTAAQKHKANQNAKSAAATKTAQAPAPATENSRQQ